MKIENEIPLVPLKDIAIIQKGVWITKKIKETYSLEYLEEKYGIKKNDVVISRTMYTSGKKNAFVVNDTNIGLIPSGLSLIIRPNTEILNSLYLKAVLEFLPLDRVIKELKIKNKKKFLSVRKFQKLKIPLPKLDYQISLSSEYDNVRKEDLANWYITPTLEQYYSLRKFLSKCYYGTKVTYFKRIGVNNYERSN